MSDQKGITRWHWLRQQWYKSVRDEHCFSRIHRFGLTRIVLNSRKHRKQGVGAQLPLEFIHFLDICTGHDIEAICFDFDKPGGTSAYHITGVGIILVE